MADVPTFVALASMRGFAVPTSNFDHKDILPIRFVNVSDTSQGRCSYTSFKCFTGIGLYCYFRFIHRPIWQMVGYLINIVVVGEYIILVFCFCKRRYGVYFFGDLYVYRTCRVI